MRRAPDGCGSRALRGPAGPCSPGSSIAASARDQPLRDRCNGPPRRGGRRCFRTAHTLLEVNGPASMSCASALLRGPHEPRRHGADPRRRSRRASPDAPVLELADGRRALRLIACCRGRWKSGPAATRKRVPRSDPPAPLVGWRFAKQTRQRPGEVLEPHGNVPVLKETAIILSFAARRRPHARMGAEAAGGGLRMLLVFDRACCCGFPTCSAGSVPPW